MAGVWIGEMSNDKGLCAIHILVILLWITFVDKSKAVLIIGDAIAFLEAVGGVTVL